MKLFSFLIASIVFSNVLIGCNNPGNHNDFNIAIGNGEQSALQHPTKESPKCDTPRQDEKSRTKDRWSRLGRINKA